MRTIDISKDSAQNWKELISAGNMSSRLIRILHQENTTQIQHCWRPGHKPPSSLRRFPRIREHQKQFPTQGNTMAPSRSSAMILKPSESERRKRPSTTPTWDLVITSKMRLLEALYQGVRQLQSRNLRHTRRPQSQLQTQVMHTWKHLDKAWRESTLEENTNSKLTPIQLQASMKLTPNSLSHRVWLPQSRSLPLATKGQTSTAQNQASMMLISAALEAMPNPSRLVRRPKRTMTPTWVQVTTRLTLLRTGSAVRLLPPSSEKNQTNAWRSQILPQNLGNTMEACSSSDLVWTRLASAQSTSSRRIPTQQ